MNVAGERVFGPFRRVDSILIKTAARAKLHIASAVAKVKSLRDAKANAHPRLAIVAVRSLTLLKTAAIWAREHWRFVIAGCIGALVSIVAFGIGGLAMLHFGLMIGSAIFALAYLLLLLSGKRSGRFGGDWHFEASSGGSFGGGGGSFGGGGASGGWGDGGGGDGGGGD